MTYLAAVLVLALVATNVIWLYYFIGHLDKERSERWQLQERIRTPESEHIPIGELIEQAKNNKVEIETKDMPEPEYEPIDEIDLVGSVNPATPLREDENE